MDAPGPAASLGSLRPASKHHDRHGFQSLPGRVSVIGVAALGAVGVHLGLRSGSVLCLGRRFVNMRVGFHGLQRSHWRHSERGRAAQTRCDGARDDAARTGSMMLPPRGEVSVVSPLVCKAVFGHLVSPLGFAT